VGVGLFLVKGWGVPFFEPGRKKTLGIRAIFSILGIQKAQKTFLSPLGDFSQLSWLFADFGLFFI
jgi:hypothetical protein